MSLQVKQPPDPCLGQSCRIQNGLPCMGSAGAVSALLRDTQEKMPEEDVVDVLGRESHSPRQLGLFLVYALVFNENGPQ